MLNEVLRQLRYDFLVPIDEYCVAVQCETLSDLEHYVYTQVSEFRMSSERRDEFRVLILGRINRGAERDLSKPLTTDDFDVDLAQLAQERMTDRWDQTMFQIGRPINRHGYEIDHPKWAVVVETVLSLSLFALSIFLWIRYGSVVGVLSLIGTLVVSNMVSQWIPFRAAKNTGTLGAAIDLYIDEVLNQIEGVSFIDVQLRVRRVHAAVWGIDFHLIDGDWRLIPDRDA